MTRDNDPSFHRELEMRFIQHVQGLLDDPRVRVDTSRGRRPVTSLLREVNRTDHGVELKRMMVDARQPDRTLEAAMPRGEVVDVLLARRKFLLLRQPVARMRIVCASPARQLLNGTPPTPMGVGEVQKVLSEIPPPLRGVPSTVVLMSTSGFSAETHELAERRADRTLILVEPNAAGGWAIWGPSQTLGLNVLFDPETEEQKRQRLHETIEQMRGQWLNSSLGSDMLAERTQLPIQWIEAELKQYAKQTSGLSARRLDGKVVIFPDRSVSSELAPSAGGVQMPLLDRIRSLFSRKGEHEKKIAFLSERRAALSQKRDQDYEDMAALEAREAELREQFKQTPSPLTRRRITSQLLQLQKDIERRQQLLSVLNQQINVVSTHLHTLELVRQGESARLPDSEELTRDAVAAEEMLADLQASNELAGSVGVEGANGLTEEEQALYEQLEQESSGSSVQPESGERTASSQAGGEALGSRNPPTTSRQATSPQAHKQSEPEAG